MEFHKPILLNETIEGLKIVPQGVYVDMTFGGGGHSREILNKLNAEGCLIGFDQDKDAWQNDLNDERFSLLRSNFRYAHKFLRLLNIDNVDGIMADLGVSSHQFDVAERGFSYRYEAKLDMRMNRKQSKTAIDIINEYSEAELLRIFSEYGEIRNSRQLARNIVSKRKGMPILTSEGLEQTIDSVIRGERNRYLAQLYQAIRIEVNDELGALRDMLSASAEMLKPGGRLAIISFHSIEDRIVKRFIKTGNVQGKVEKDAFGVVQRPFKEVVKGVVLPSDEERRANPRSNSAKLRIAEKL
jgi:16S rRNA (cytosine1402-N4)-methyltransferase